MAPEPQGDGEVHKAAWERIWERMETRIKSRPKWSYKHFSYSLRRTFKAKRGETQSIMINSIQAVQHHSGRTGAWQDIMVVYSKGLYPKRRKLEVNQTFQIICAEMLNRIRI